MNWFDLSNASAAYEVRKQKLQIYIETSKLIILLEVLTSSSDPSGWTITAVPIVLRRARRSTYSEGWLDLPLPEQIVNVTMRMVCLPIQIRHVTILLNWFTLDLRKMFTIRFTAYEFFEKHVSCSKRISVTDVFIWHQSLYVTLVGHKALHH